MISKKEFYDVYYSIFSKKEEPKRKKKEKKEVFYHEDAMMELLRPAIVEQAAKDYIFSLKRGRLTEPNGVLEMEKFFRSDYYKLLVNYKIDGDQLIIDLRKKAISSLEEQLKDEKKKSKIRKIRKQIEWIKQLEAES